MEIPQAQEALSGLRGELARRQEFCMFVWKEKLASYKFQRTFLAVAHESYEAADAALA